MHQFQCFPVLPTLCPGQKYQRKRGWTTWFELTPVPWLTEIQVDCHPPSCTCWGNVERRVEDNVKRSESEKQVNNYKPEQNKYRIIWTCAHPLNESTFVELSLVLWRDEERKVNEDDQRVGRDWYFSEKTSATTFPEFLSSNVNRVYNCKLKILSSYWFIYAGYQSNL